jgi:hypothetical protein
MSNHLGLLITTCKHYFTNIPNVIKDIEECHFPKENVLIVSGQESNNSICYENNIKIVKVDYTGLHLTGLVYLSENIFLFKHINYWITLPDTIKLNKLFYVKILEYYSTYLENKEICSLPFISPKLRPTMDMGIVHISHIYNMSDYLKKIKMVQPYTIDEIFQLKIQLIWDENIILGLLPGILNEATKFNYINQPTPMPTIFITNNTTELIEKKITFNDKILNEIYIVNLDFYKYQRNFSGAYAKLVMEL